MAVKLIKSDSPVSTTQVLSKLQGKLVRIRPIHAELLGYL